MTSTTIKRILFLGSGMVATPCLEYLSRKPENHFTIVCRNLAAAQKLAAGFSHTTAIILDVTSESELEERVAAHDVVISLIPYFHHTTVIKAAIKGRTHVITTSYISPAILQLPAATRKAGITILNEVGLDPGIDHLYVTKKINEVHAQGGESPRGALFSQRNAARFLEAGEIREIGSEDLMSTAAPYYVKDGYEFVAYANRDSVPFQAFYRIPEAHTVIRGSLRYKDNPAFVQALANLGWLDQSHKEWLKDGMTWVEIQQTAIAALNASADLVVMCLISRITEVVQFEREAESERIIKGMKWMGTLSAERATIKRMSFGPGERDLVILQHKFIVESADGEVETFTSTLELFGDPERYSGVALAVGVTCGIATQLLMDGHEALRQPGVFAPYAEETCDPIRRLVEKEGIIMVEDQVL
ncbi:saccharopine dehydrogenase [Plenodomus tracheiphilus IPT5]|uniref:Saccharopine dehydrogenase n=1 Tax=Plenodomus tracheiphilus IPT5 TaxID=1408161 RepID=A0A6A7BDP2_9PLEO|nr:saccharopine dehydrogenase [Plenodomus tracheiphilus IPT5]